MVFSCGSVWMRELDCEESWAPKNWCFWTVVLEKTLKSLGLQGDPTSPFWRRLVLGVLWKVDAKAETPVLWPPHVKSWLTGKDPDAGRDWGQEEKGTTEDEMAGWHHGLDGRKSEWTPSWWWTGRPGMLWFMESQRVKHDWVNWTENTLVFKQGLFQF